MKRKVIRILGGGVVGLSCANVLANDFDVTVVADGFGLGTASRVATAIWHIYLVDPNNADALRWAELTLEKLMHLADCDVESGVSLINGVELFRRSEKALPPWHKIPPFFEMLSDEEVANFPGVTWAYRLLAPVANMETYLPWLQRSAASKGVTFTKRHVRSIEEIALGCDAVVNCSGMGARELVGDSQLIPVRGQYIVFPSSDEAPRAYLGDDHHPEGTAYVIPRDGEICVGGTEEYEEYKSDFCVAPSELLRRAGQYVPWLNTLKEADIKRKVVGLRPYRVSGVRLELDHSIASVPVVHNYGHGGSGFSLSWGCAEDCRSMLKML